MGEKVNNEPDSGDEDEERKWAVIDGRGRSKGNVVGIRLFGRLSADDKGLLHAQVRHLVVIFGRVRVLVDVDADYREFSAQLMQSELASVWEFAGRIERLAIVHDSRLVRLAAAVGSSLTFLSAAGSSERAFTHANCEAAWDWVRGAGMLLLQNNVDPMQFPPDAPGRASVHMRVLVVGAGVAGLSLAAVLIRRGFHNVRVIERAVKLGTHAGRMDILWPNAWGVLRQIDTELVPAVEAASIPLRTLHSTDLTEIWDRFGPVRAVQRNVLERLINVALQRNLTIRDTGSVASASGGGGNYYNDSFVVEEKAGGGISGVSDLVSYNCKVTALSQSNNEIVAQFSDGQKESYDVIVGSDSVNSNIKNMLHNLDSASVSAAIGKNSAGVRVWAFLSDIRINTACVEFKGIKGKYVWLCMTPEHRTAVLCAVYVESRKDDPIQGDRPSRLREIFRELPDIMTQILAQVPPVDQLYTCFIPDYFGLNDGSGGNWSKARITLLGAAAHPIMPWTHLPATLSLESAVVLANELEKTDTRYISFALQNYERKRKNRLNHLFHNHNYYDYLKSWFSSNKNDFINLNYFINMLTNE